MECLGQPLEVRSLCVRAVSYKYRYCPRCSLEWPANYKSCPECVHWLGDDPLERTEWQVVPATIAASATERYELIGAGALALRLVCGDAPSDAQMADLAELIAEIVAVTNGGVCEVAGYGWLIWTGEGLRQAFRQACEIERRLAASLPRLKNVLLHVASGRWGIWIDQYIVPFDKQNRPTISDITAVAIFHFEPDKMALSSEAAYQTNRR